MNKSLQSRPHVIVLWGGNSVLQYALDEIIASNLINRTKFCVNFQNNWHIYGLIALKEQQFQISFYCLMLSFDLDLGIIQTSQQNLTVIVTLQFGLYYIV